MVKILFVCHGNICRSPMAEFLFKDLLKKNNVEKLFHVESAATSSEELGNGVHYGTRKILNSLGIDCSSKKARKITYNDYKEYDYIIGMDEYNLRNMKLFFNNTEKLYSLLEFAGIHRGIKDPWYTGNFNETYDDIMIGLNALYDYLIKK